jgi:hypothetical protein
MDHAGLPEKIVMEQLDLLGEEVVPVLRAEFAKLRPAHVPEGPTHEALVLARDTELAAAEALNNADAGADAAGAAGAQSDAAASTDTDSRSSDAQRVVA